MNCQDYAFVALHIKYCNVVPSFANWTWNYCAQKF